MVREDIVAGLRNALDRGNSFEAAKQSLLNAGYSSEDIAEAGNYINAGSVLPLHEVQRIKKPADSVVPSKTRPQKPSKGPSTGQGFFSRNWKVILLLAVLFVLIGLFVLVLLFRETISGWFW
jgi:hypothetical protein